MKHVTMSSVLLVLGVRLLFLKEICNLSTLGVLFAHMIDSIFEDLDLHKVPKVL